MALRTLRIVSKRLQLVTAALLCLAAMQLADAIASRNTVPVGAVRVAISR
jgi:hypothetical protein